MMPQKKNPYPFEYARFAATHVTGDMTGAFASLHNVNYQDTKDVEEGLAPPVFHALDETARVLELLTGVFSTVTVDAEAMKRQAARHFASCTELAAVIHRNSKLSFRSAHRIVGNLVLRALKHGKDATEVDAALVNESAREVYGEDLPIDDAIVRGALDPESFVQVHTVAGGPARAPMKAALSAAYDQARADRERVDALGDRLDQADGKLDAAVDKWL